MFGWASGGSGGWRRRLAASPGWGRGPSQRPPGPAGTFAGFPGRTHSRPLSKGTPGGAVRVGPARSEGPGQLALADWVRPAFPEPLRLGRGAETQGGALGLSGCGEPGFFSNLTFCSQLPASCFSRALCPCLPALQGQGPGATRALSGAPSLPSPLPEPTHWFFRMKRHTPPTTTPALPGSPRPKPRPALLQPPALFLGRHPLWEVGGGGGF